MCPIRYRTRHFFNNSNTNEDVATKFEQEYVRCVRNTSLIHKEIQCVPLATEPDISLIILTPMKILQRNLDRSTFVVWEMKRNVSVVRFKFRCSILIGGKIIKELPGSVASGTLFIKKLIYSKG